MHGCRLRVVATILAGRRLLGSRAATAVPGRWTALRVRVRLPRRSMRLRAVARDTRTGEVLARSGLLRVFR
jgi:hypothetical protein